MSSRKNLTLVLPFALSLSSALILLFFTLGALTAYAAPGILHIATDGNDASDCSNIANHYRTVRQAIALTAQLLETETQAPNHTESDKSPIRIGSPYLHGPVSSLATTVSGNISGTWTASGNPYVVTGDLVIAASNALTIQPGVEVRFAGSYSLTVYGDLLGNGTAAAPITFTSHLPLPQRGDWGGIQFYNSGDNDRLSHVRIEFAQTGIEVEAENGTASPTIEYSVITYSLADGISISADAGTGDAYARPDILSSTIYSNGGKGIYAYGRGGGDDYDDGHAEPTIRYSTISNNNYGIFLYGKGGSDQSADGYASGDVISNTIIGNGLDGIYLHGKGGSHSGLFNPDGYAEGDIISNTIIGNGRYGIYLFGEGNSTICTIGLDCNGYASPNIIGNVIADNDSTGIFIKADGQEWPSLSNNKGYASPLVANNIIVNNNGYGLYTSASDQFDRARPRIIHNTIVSNTLAGMRSTDEVYSNTFKIYNNLIISHTIGLSANEGEIPDVGYNGLWGNTTDFSDYPPSYGVIATSNANGDPSDSYYNIFLDPRFVDVSTRDYHLRGDSPAISAGCDQDYAPQYDMDGDSRHIGLAPDLGADEYPGDEFRFFLSLPIVMKGYCSCGPDNYEPNDSCNQAYGPLISGQTYQSYISCCDLITHKKSDYFYIDISTKTAINIYLTNIPAGTDYDLCLYRNPSDDPNNPAACSRNGGNSPETISYNPPAIGKYYIRVYAYSGYSASPYSLRVNYDE